MKKLLRTQLVESKSKVEVIRSDPKSPLYSVRTFEELKLPEELLKGLYDLGFQKPSKIQETVLPLLMANPPQNLIAQSQSGTGKTAAFLLASLKRVRPELMNPQVLILSPTLELAIQIADVAKRMARFTKITFRHVIKGEARPTGPVEEHVIIGTPGKLSGRYPFCAFANFEFPLQKPNSEARLQSQTGCFGLGTFSTSRKSTCLFSTRPT